MPGNRTK